MPMRTNVIDFNYDLKAFADKTRLEMEAVVRGVLLELFRRIVVRTPVDTGRAAGSWNVSRGEPGDDMLPEQAEGKHAPRAEAIAQRLLSKVNAVSFDPPGAIFYIYNNLPYIQVLEFGLYPDPPKRGSYVKGQGYVIKTVGGYSKQAPAGMVRLSIAELETDLEMFLRAATRESR